MDASADSHDNPSGGEDQEGLIGALAEDLARLHEVVDELGRKLAALEAEHTLHEAADRG